MTLEQITQDQAEQAKYITNEFMQRLEGTIGNAICNFERETGIKVAGVDFIRKEAVTFIGEDETLIVKLLYERY